jgi:hypothetical protein
MIFCSLKSFAVKHEHLARCEAFKKTTKIQQGEIVMKKAMSKLGKWLWNFYHICTVVLFALGLYQVAIRQVETKVFWDPDNATDMVVPGTFGRPADNATVSSDKADFVPASVSDDYFAICLENFSEFKRRVEGKPPAKESEVLAGCCDDRKLDNAALGDCTRRVRANSR